ncbi:MULTISPECIES: EscU/YscU/HrcU family type III secretion system export apparatus switch protein [unclassified Helicobacter]|uniref:EscU/YscU/HrcU family type III secretion system export apparatus switch protein n=1 Tax=unclassified Helicobacter TaxID=2593540 RepID=UPI000CF064B4|nr:MULTISPECIES: EscU/YscU/HrcU family type III secretion system export apparatus switch protein [unclassified Helicobacter]
MKKAAALSYQKQIDHAPKVVASGKGAIAEKIIQKAKEFDVPLFSNRALVDSLLKIEIDDEIPQELYSSTVEVFIWLNKIETQAQVSKNY